MLEIDKLLVDHEGESACGEDLEYDALLLEVREAVEGKAEQRIGDEVIEAEESDWKLVKKNCLKLCDDTHNLEVVVSLTQALMHLEGYSGLAEGSALLAGVIEKYWDCLYPEIDPSDNDPIERMNMLAVFEDFNYLLTLQKVQLISSKGVGSVSIYDIRQSKSPNDSDDDNAIDGQLIGAVFKSCPDDQKESVYSWLEQCVTNFEKISSLLREQEHVGATNAPDFVGLLKIVNEAKSAVGEYLGHSEVSAEGGESELETGSSGSAAPVAQSRGINSRQDVISAIKKIEEYYYKNEPGSPIPLLLQRARNLVDKDFISLMEDLAPDSINQVEVVLGAKQS